MIPLKAMFPLVVLAVTAGGVLLSHTYAAFAFAGVVLALLIHPMLDAAFGIDDTVAPESSHPLYNLILWAYVPCQIATTVGALHFTSSLAVGSAQWLGAMLSIGVLNGAVGITAAHELIHRRRRWERGLGVALLVSVCFAHFRVEHVFGHHRHVGTDHDPGSARLGEGLYRFWIRSMLGEIRSAWQIEARRVAARGKWYGNRMFHYLAVYSLMFLAIRVFFGASALVFFLGQSLIAILMLETISYIEHYGLRRREIAPGRFEAVSTRHSWDSGHAMTNAFLFNLGKHSHHHRQSSVPYQNLSLSQDSLRLPYGYSTMFLLAFIPPLWKRVMDPKVASVD